MGVSPQEQAKSLILANLAKKGYRKLPFEISVEERHFGGLTQTSVRIPLLSLCDSTIVPFLLKQLGIVTNCEFSTTTSYRNGDENLVIWYDLGKDARLEIIRKGDLTDKDIDLVADLYHVCNDYVIQRKKEKDSDDDDATAKRDSKLLTIEQKLTAAGAIVHPPGTLDFNVLSGYQTLKTEVQETIILRMKHPEVYEQVMRATRQREEKPTAQTVLFEGPPGTGKTTMGRIIASLVECPFVYLPFENIRSRYYGDTERNLGSVFDLCATYPKTVLFLDEIDTLANSRNSDSDSGASSRVLGVLLRKMDGFQENRTVLVIGTTNRPEDLDPALKSRFKRRIYFDLPNCVERAYIFEAYAKHLNSDEVVHLAQLTDGFSGRDILNACQATEERWARNIIEGKAKDPTPAYLAYKATLEQRTEKTKEKLGF